ncbi:MAG: cupin [Pseudomonadota bacterium]
MNEMCRGHALKTSQVDDSRFEIDGPRAFFGYRDPGIAQVSKGRFGAHATRGVPLPHRASQRHTDDRDFRMDYVTRDRDMFGDAQANADVTSPALRAGSCSRRPAGVRHRGVTLSTDMEPIEVFSPAGVPTRPSEVP